MGLGLHVRLDLAGLAVRGLRHRCVCQADCGLAREQLDAPRTSCSTPWSKLFTTANLTRDRSLIHHSDQRVRNTCQHPVQRTAWAEAGIEPSVGSKGDSYDNALAETINGLYKAELIHRRAPWKTQARPSNWQRLNGFRGSTTIDCSNPLATFHRPRPRQTTTGNSPVRLPRRPPDLTQRASAIPGAVQCARRARSPRGKEFRDLLMLTPFSIEGASSISWAVTPGPRQAAPSTLTASWRVRTCSL